MDGLVKLLKRLVYFSPIGIMIGIPLALCLGFVLWFANTVFVWGKSDNVFKKFIAFYFVSSGALDVMLMIAVRSTNHHNFLFGFDMRDGVERLILGAIAVFPIWVAYIWLKWVDETLEEEQMIYDKELKDIRPCTEEEIENKAYIRPNKVRRELIWWIIFFGLLSFYWHCGTVLSR